MCHTTVIEKIPSIVFGSGRSPSRHEACVHWRRRCWRRGGWQWAARSGRWPWSTSCCAAWTPRPRCALPTLKAAPSNLEQGKTYRNCMRHSRSGRSRAGPMSSCSGSQLDLCSSDLICVAAAGARGDSAAAAGGGAAAGGPPAGPPPAVRAAELAQVPTVWERHPLLISLLSDMTVIRNHSSLGSARHSPQGNSVACSTKAGAVRAPSGAAALTLLAQQRRQDVAVACLLCAAPGDISGGGWSRRRRAACAVLLARRMA